MNPKKGQSFFWRLPSLNRREAAPLYKAGRETIPDFVNSAFLIPVSYQNPVQRIRPVFVYRFQPFRQRRGKSVIHRQVDMGGFAVGVKGFQL